MEKTLRVKTLLILGPRLGKLDEWGHRLRLPKFILYSICDAWDWHLGVYDEFELPLEHWSGDHETDTGADCKD